MRHTKFSPTYAICIGIVAISSLWVGPNSIFARDGYLTGVPVQHASNIVTSTIPGLNPSQIHHRNTLTHKTARTEAGYRNNAWTFNAAGNPVKYEKDFNQDGVPDEIKLWQYDQNERLIRYETDLFGDGDIVEVQTWNYDDNNQVISHQMYSTANPQNKWTAFYSYTPDGKISRIQLYCDQDGTATRIVSYEYNDNGDLVAEKIEVKPGKS